MASIKASIATPPIQVWRPEIAIPGPLADEVRRYTTTHHRSVNTEQFIHGIEVVTVLVDCEWHNDLYVAEFSCFVVLRNDHDAFVRVRGVPPVEDQPVGTMILLDVRRTHKLAYPKGPPGIWAAVCIDYDGGRVPSREECEDDMREMLGRVR